VSGGRTWIIATVAVIALVLAAAVGYAAQRNTAGPAVGTVEARFACPSTSGSLCGGYLHGALPALVFSQGSCPRSTIAVGNAHDDVIRIVLPAGSYRVAVLLANVQLVEPKNHATVTVHPGTTTHLGVMQPRPDAAPYPIFCD
jgi:hypothetical protein